MLKWRNQLHNIIHVFIIKIIHMWWVVIASVIRLTMHAQRTCYVGRCWCWSRVSDPGPTLGRYWYSVSCLLVCAFIAQQTRHVDPSTTPGQHWPSAGSAYRVCWVCSNDTDTCHYKTNIALLITVKSILYRYSRGC